MAALPPIRLLPVSVLPPPSGACFIQTVDGSAGILGSAAAASLLAASPGALDVLAERGRQVTEEGWTAEHDDAHARGELALAGTERSHRRGARWAATQLGHQPPTHHLAMGRKVVAAARRSRGPGPRRRPHHRRDRPAGPGRDPPRRRSPGQHRGGVTAPAQPPPTPPPKEP